MRRSRKTSPLPVRNGVSSHAVFLPPGPWSSVLAFLCERFPAVSREQWLQRMQQGEVVDGQGRPLPADAVYGAGMHLHYYREVKQETPVPFHEQIIFEDEHLLVADKPHFLPTQPSGGYLHETLVARLRRSTGNAELEPLHRLDRETAGLVLFSKNRQQRAAYHALFREQRIQKTYQAIAPLQSALQFPLVHRSHIGQDQAFHRRCELPGPPNSETRIDLVEHRGEWGRYRMLPSTGKTHQLRIHLAAVGIPIRNDPLYPRDLQRAPDDFSAPLQLLASRLVFVDPLNGATRCFFTRFELLLPAE